MPTLTKKICSVNDCERKHYAKGYCNPHRARILKHGDVAGDKPIKIRFMHGLTGHYLHGMWRGMLMRCRNPNFKDYRLYGGRGITVCKRWLNFANFVEDMGERPDGYSIDRIDVNGNYEPSNCQWATSKEQRLNQRNMVG